MYFDHVKCPSCGAAFDPEAVGSRSGSLTCPACGSQLELRALFGLNSAFAEEEAESMSIDDLVPGRSGPVAEGTGGGQGRAASAMDALRGGSSKDLPARQGGKGASDTPSAADVLRGLKRR